MSTSKVIALLVAVAIIPFILFFTVILNGPLYPLYESQVVRPFLDPKNAQTIRKTTSTLSWKEYSNGALKMTLQIPENWNPREFSKASEAYQLFFDSKNYGSTLKVSSYPINKRSNNPLDSLSISKSDVEKMGKVEINGKQFLKSTGYYVYIGKDKIIEFYPIPSVVFMDGYPQSQQAFFELIDKVIQSTIIHE